MCKLTPHNKIFLEPPLLSIYTQEPHIRIMRMYLMLLKYRKLIFFYSDTEEQRLKRKPISVKFYLSEVENIRQVILRICSYLFSLVDYSNIYIKSFYMHVLEF